MSIAIRFIKIEDYILWIVDELTTHLLIDSTGANTYDVTNTPDHVKT